MVKRLVTAEELESFLMLGAKKITECEGLSGVTILSIDDGRVPYNWTVSQIHDGSPMCRIAIDNMVEGMQLIFDLKT